MLQHYHSVLSLTVTATTIFDAHDLISFADAKIVADDVAVKAVAQNPATEVGLDVAGTAIGTHQVRARGAITKGTKVVSAAAGGVKAYVSGTHNNPFATALTDAADGALVTVLIK